MNLTGGIDLYTEGGFIITDGGGGRFFSRGIEVLKETVLGKHTPKGKTRRSLTSG